MPFICEFEMRVKGREKDVVDFINNTNCIFLHCYKQVKVKEGVVGFVSGKCINSINESFIAIEKERKNLEDWSREEDLEIEIAGMVPGDRELLEHYHYKNGELIYVLDLPQYISKRSVSEGVKVPLEKYNYHNKKKGYYTIKPEYTERIEWNKINGELIVNMRIDNEPKEHDNVEQMLVLTILHDYKEEFDLSKSDLDDIVNNQLLLYDIADTISKHLQDSSLGKESLQVDNSVLRKVNAVLEIYGY